MFPGLCEGKFKGKDKSCEVSQSSVGFRIIPVQVPAGVGILGAAAAICFEFVLVGAFGAAASELLYSVLFAAFAAAAICHESVLVGAFGAAASELLYSVLFAAFAAAAICYELVLVGAFVIWIGATTALLIAVMCSALSAAAFITLGCGSID